MDLYHITIAAPERHTLFPGEADLRAAVRAVARVAGGSLALFSVVDDHVHLVAVGTRPEAGRRAQAISIALGRLGSRPLEPARIRPVKGRHHMGTLVPYLLNQPVHHGLPTHPALWSGSAFPDLIGARVVPGLSLRLREVLPRRDPKSLLEVVGLGGIALRPLPLPDIRVHGAFGLASAASAALAAPPDLSGKSSPVQAAKAAVARLAEIAGIPSSEVAAALDVTRRTARRLRTASTSRYILDAVRRRLSLEGAVAYTASNPTR